MIIMYYYYYYYYYSIIIVFIFLIYFIVLFHYCFILLFYFIVLLLAGPGSPQASGGRGPWRKPIRALMTKGRPKVRQGKNNNMEGGHEL